MERLFFSILLPTLGLLSILIALLIGTSLDGLIIALENQQIDPTAFVGSTIWISGMFALPTLAALHPRIIWALLALWLVGFGLGVCLFLNLPLLTEVSGNQLRFFSIIALLQNAMMLIFLAPRHKFEPAVA